MSQSHCLDQWRCKKKIPFHANKNQCATAHNFAYSSALASRARVDSNVLLNSTNRDAASNAFDAEQASARSIRVQPLAGAIDVWLYCAWPVNCSV